jgi:hypothetical protein
MHAEHAFAILHVAAAPHVERQRSRPCRGSQPRLLSDNRGHERAASRTRASSNAGLLSRIGRVSHLASFGFRRHRVGRRPGRACPGSSLLSARSRNVVARLPEEAPEPESRCLPSATCKGGLAEERPGIPVGRAADERGLRYSVPLCVAFWLRGRAAGAGARRSSWLLRAPHRWGSSRNGAWRAGMISRCALGISLVARRPISGPP